MLAVGRLRSDHEFDQPPTLYYTTLCPVVSVVVGVHNQLSTKHSIKGWLSHLESLISTHQKESGIFQTCSKLYLVNQWTVMVFWDV